MEAASSLQSREGQILTATPTILESMLAPLEEEQLCWKPAPERWSVTEILSHLIDVEKRNLRARTSRIVAEELPTLVDYDQNLEYAGGTYANEGGRRHLEEFCSVRRESLEFLGTVPRVAWDREARHPEVGRVSFGEIISLWAFHDLGHIRQVAELIRACCFWEPMRRMQRYYSVDP